MASVGQIFFSLKTEKMHIFKNIRTFPVVLNTYSHEHVFFLDAEVCVR